MNALLAALAALLVFKPKSREIPQRGDSLARVAAFASKLSLGKATGVVESQENGGPCTCPPGTPMEGQRSKYSSYLDMCICGQSDFGAAGFELVGRGVEAGLDYQSGGAYSKTKAQVSSGNYQSAALQANAGITITQSKK